MANRIDRVKMENDLFLEMLEVYINSILYVRDVYPAAIFRKRRVYSTIAYISIYPPLNRYLLNTLKTAQELQAAGKLFQVELIIFQKRGHKLFSVADDEEILEKYIFRIESNENPDNSKMDLDASIFRFEEELRRGLLELNQKTKHLNQLKSESCGFRIHLETTEKAFVDVVNKDNSKTECFPWVLADENSRNNDIKTGSIPSWYLLPVVQADSFSLLIHTTQRP